MFQTTFSNRVYVNPNRKSLQFSAKSTKFSITYYERLNIGSKRKTRAQFSTPKTPRPWTHTIAGFTAETGVRNTTDNHKGRICLFLGVQPWLKQQMLSWWVEAL